MKITKTEAVVIVLLLIMIGWDIYMLIVAWSFPLDP